MCIPGTAISRYINFYTDFAFKKIFGTEANKDLLISFLNCLFCLEGDAAIEDVTYLNSEQLGDSRQERRAIYDVYCKTVKGERFIVEMQKAQQDNFRDRALYYSSFAIREQAVKGSKDRPWDYELAPVYVVGVLNFNMDSTNTDKCITRVQLKDDENRVFTENLNFVFLEMPKFNKKENELDNFLDKWLFVLKNLYKLKEQPQALTEGIFRKLFEVAEIASFSANERSNYEESLKNFWDLNNCLDSAERKGFEKGEASGMKKGKEEGLAEGLEKGLEQGEAIGLEKGLEQGEAIGLEKGLEQGEAIGLEKGLEQGEAIGLEKGEAIGLEKGEAIGLEKGIQSVAKSMKQAGVSTEDIAKFTGLSIQDIERL